MKNKVLLGVMAATAFSLWAAPKKNTIDSFLSDPDKFLNQAVNLSVSHISPLAYRGNIPNVVFFNVYTDGENGMRSLPLVVNSSSAKIFAQEYGTKTATEPKDYRMLSGKFRFVDMEMQKKIVSTGLWHIGFVSGAYFIDATTEGQLDEVFDWYPEKTAAIAAGKNVERVSAKETTTEAAVSSAMRLVRDAEERSAKKATIVKQDLVNARDKKICIVEYTLD